MIKNELCHLLVTKHDMGGGTQSKAGCGEAIQVSARNIPLEKTMLKIPVGFVVCPCCGMAFPLTVTTTDEAHLRAHLRSDAPVKCPTCNHAFACGSAKSYVQEELIQ